MPFPGIVNPPRAGARRSLTRSFARFMLHLLTVGLSHGHTGRTIRTSERTMHTHVEQIGSTRVLRSADTGPLLDGNALRDLVGDALGH